MSIGSYRFLDFASRQVMKAWAARQEPGIIPFTPLAKPLRELSMRDLPMPALGPDDVLVRVHAAALNPRGLLRRQR
jgi:hypothetical protein